MILPSNGKSAALVYAPIEKRGKYVIVIKTNKKISSEIRSSSTSFIDATHDPAYRTLTSNEHGYNEFCPQIYKNTVREFIGGSEFRKKGISFQLEKTRSDTGGQLGIKLFASQYASVTDAESITKDVKSEQKKKEEGTTNESEKIEKKS